jgi:hypothetical protein
VEAVSLHLEVALGPEYTYRPGPPFVYEGAVTISVHLHDAKGLLDDVGISGTPDELDRLAGALHHAAAQARAAVGWLPGQPDAQDGEDHSPNGGER